MLFISEMKVSVMKYMSLSSKIFSPFVHVCKPSDMRCNHGQRVQGEEQLGVPHSALCSLAPSVVTPSEELSSLLVVPKQYL